MGNGKDKNVKPKQLKLELQELQERTGADLAECEKALIDAKGDSNLAAYKIDQQKIKRAKKKSHMSELTNNLGQWSIIMIRGAIHGVIAGAGIIIRTFLEMGWATTLGNIIFFAAFITFFWPLSWRGLLVGFPVFLVIAGIIVAIAAFIMKGLAAEG